MSKLSKQTSVKVDLVTIDAARINDVCENYFHWKDLNERLTNFCSRGINFPDAISEPMGCYALGYLWNKGTAGDAYNKTETKKIEFKATSNYDSDLTSFGPKTDFDDFVFLRLDYQNNLLYVYDTGMNHKAIENLKVNQSQTIHDQQLQGRRPHIRIIEELIEPTGMQPTCILNIRTMKIQKLKETKEEQPKTLFDD